MVKKQTKLLFGVTQVFSCLKKLLKLELLHSKYLLRFLESVVVCLWKSIFGILSDSRGINIVFIIRLSYLADNPGKDLYRSLPGKSNEGQNLLYNTCFLFLLWKKKISGSTREESGISRRF